MANAKNNYIVSLPDITAALKTALEALTIDGSTCFERVEPFRSTDLEDALRKLITNNNRTALIVYTGDDHESTVEARTITTKIKNKFEIVFSDRRIANPNAATEYIEVLKDLLISTLTGTLIPANDDHFDIYSVTTGAERLLITADDAAKFPGRSAMNLSLEIRGSWIQSAIAYSPTNG